MDDFDTRKIELLRPLMFEAAATLFDCQHFEFGVALLLFHFARLGNRGLNPEKISLILDDKDKKTAGQLVAMLKKHLTLSDGILQALEEALTARNRLIHRVLVDNIEHFMQEETRSTLAKEIRALRRKVKKGDQELRPFILAFNQALDNDSRRIEQEIRQLLS